MIFTPFVFRSEEATQSSGGTVPTSGLVFDLDARFNVYTDAGVTPAGDSDSIQEWTTNDVGAYTFEQLTAADKPTLFQNATFGGQPYVRFLGTASSLVEHMIAPYNANFELQDMTIFMVGRNRNSSLNGSFDHFFMFGNGVDEGYKAYLGNTGGSEFEFVAGDWISDFVDVAQTTQQEYIYQMRYDPSTNLNVRLDDGTQATDTAAASISYTNTTANSTGFVIGGGMQFNGVIVRELSCDIARLIVYDRYMDDTERDEVLTTLNGIYSIY